MKKYGSFLMVWVVNFAVITIAFVICSKSIVLGTWRLTPLLAGIVASFLLTLICRLSKLISHKLGLKIKGRAKKFLFYWGINSVAIWLIARFAYLTGLGISAFYWAIVLGFVTSFAQWVLRQGLKATKLLK